jgi:glycosyltransferase involved in cell wall biosynthesis
MGAVADAQARGDAGPSVRGPLRLAVVGLSIRDQCGVHDHGRLLGEALARAGATVSHHWLTRRELDRLGPARVEIDEWASRLTGALTAERPDAIILHYSVFSYAHKGVPVFVRPVLAALRPLGVPLLNVMHEFAYPWRYGGWRGLVWAVTQRVVLRRLVAASDAIVVTADFRASWLRSRRWLADRPVVVAPVFSNLPPPPTGAARDQAVAGTAAVGLFGFSYQGAAVALVLDAVRLLRREGRDVRLRLLGAPGADSEAGRTWRQGAAARGIAEAVWFSGPLPAADLSNELAGCAVLLFADAAGPTSRKGSLAGALASGRPVVAIDGPLTWPALVDAGAVRIAAPSAAALAAAVSALLDDGPEREALGVRGRAFYEREMDVERTATAARELLARIAPDR